MVQDRYSERIAVLETRQMEHEKRHDRYEEQVKERIEDLDKKVDYRCDDILEALTGNRPYRGNGRVRIPVSWHNAIGTTIGAGIVVIIWVIYQLATSNLF